MRFKRNIGFIAIMLVTVFALLSLGSQFVQAEKIKLEKADDLPEHTYKIEMKAVDFLENKDAVMKLAAQIKADLEADLEKYEIEDKTTLQGFYSKLGMIALLEGRHDDYLKYLNMRRGLESKESLKLTTGIFTEAYIKALNSGSEDLEAALRSEYQNTVEVLPYEVVESDLESAKGRSEIISKNLIIGMTNERTQPILDQGNGEVRMDIAVGLMNNYYALNYYIPYKHIVTDVLTGYLAAHKVVKPDIWEAREVTLDKDKKGEAIVIGIWDAGVDPVVFPQQIWTNEKEVADDGIDNDNNGFIDDMHGIAYDIYAQKTPALLYPIGAVDDRPRMQRLMKGITDLTSNIDSEEATELKGMLSSMSPDEVKPFIEDLNAYGNHCHGTHVAGIALRGNPFAKILVARLSFDHHLIPMEPTMEWAQRAANMMTETVDYFKAHNVRVVNMSWGYTLEEIKDALEKNGAGGSVEERKELTRQIFDTIKKGLYAAIEGAPDILFVCGAGNEDSDVEFDEFIPSSFDLPNLMASGAVDQAGDETDFTSFGKVDAYANGFEVLSYVPGGDQMKLSGTSMASPNICNLAGKIIATKPDLKPAQVKELIIKASEEKTAGERTIRLINPKKTFELLADMK